MSKKKTKSNRTKQRRHDRRLRRRGGVVNTIIGPDDMALIIRGKSGRLQMHHSRSEVKPGNAAFWGHLLAWLFKNDKDAAERRQILTDDFLVDIQVMQQKMREAKARAARADGPQEGEPDLSGRHPDNRPTKEQIAEVADQIAEGMEEPAEALAEQCELCDEAAAVVAADSGGELPPCEHLEEARAQVVQNLVDDIMEAPTEESEALVEATDLDSRPGGA